MVLILEYCEFGDLTLQLEYWRNLDRHMPEDFILSSAYQIFKGLAAAHKRSVLHSDIKPDNVFLKQDGTVMLGDFGCAVVLQSHEKLTFRGQYGTRGYIPPE